MTKKQLCPCSLSVQKHTSYQGICKTEFTQTGLNKLNDFLKQIYRFDLTSVNSLSTFYFINGRF